MSAEQQQRLRELALVMLRDAHGEDFTDEQAALFPAQREEYERLTEPQEILSLLEENCRLRENSARYLWLRDKSENAHPFYLSTPIWMTGVRFRQSDVDRSIDTAMVEGGANG
ncbi:hypothetical protein [Aquipseudomonas campi]